MLYGCFAGSLSIPRVSTKGAAPSAPSGAERPIPTSHNEPAYNQVGSKPDVQTDPLPLNPE